MKRLKFIKSLGALAGAGLMAGLYTWQIEPFWLEIVHQKMPIKNLPSHLVGKTLMQISDIHVSTRFDWNFLIRSFDKAQQLNPHYVVYTGDYISYEDSQQLVDLKQVLRNAVKGSIGTIGVLGNHDYGHGWGQSDVAQSVTEILTQADIQVLRNEQTDIEGLNFIGFDDCWGTNFLPKKAMIEYDKNIANIVLCHNPDVCDIDVWHGYQGWILSGHTHGGQCKPPFLPPPMLPVKNKRYTSGIFDLGDGRTLYINRALGHLWQVRFNVRPEITVFELTAA